MNRRSVLQMFGVAPTALAAASVALAKAEIPRPRIELKRPTFCPPDEFNYRGYKVWWTGWKGSPYTCDLVAQYVAFWKDKVHGLYVSNPGWWGHFRRGDQFDTRWKWPQLLTNEASQEARMATRVEMVEVIFRLIDFTCRYSLQDPTGLNPGLPLLYPEIQNYYGWKRLTAQQKYEWVDEEVLLQRILKG